MTFNCDSVKNGRQMLHHGFGWIKKSYAIWTNPFDTRGFQNFPGGSQLMR